MGHYRGFRIEDSSMITLAEIAGRAGAIGPNRRGIIRITVR